MSTQLLCINWDSHTNAMFKGLTTLRQNEEFVDMTLAAGGCLVKVHRNIISLASPYFKAMIQSASGQHPVVFLNKISSSTLGYILEYIYTGEAKIPIDEVNLFIETCKELSIKGFDPKNEHQKDPVEEVQSELPNRDAPLQDSNYAAQIIINPQSLNFEVTPIPTSNGNKTLNPDDNISKDNDQQVISSCSNKYDDVPIDIVNIKAYPDSVEPQQNGTSVTLDGNNKDWSEYLIQRDFINGNNVNAMETDSHYLSTTEHESSSKSSSKHTNQSMTPLKSSKETVNKVYYSLSNRGALQLLLNRYMYYCHHHSCGGKKRRWRCVDYRKMHCPAFIDTSDDVIVNRSEEHIHTFHDNKILKKIKASLIYTTLKNCIYKSEDLWKAKKRNSEVEYKKKTSCPERRRRKTIDADIVMNYVVKFDSEH